MKLQLAVFLAATALCDADVSQPPYMHDIYAKQLAECETIISLAPKHAGPVQYAMAARAAFELGAFEKARTYANKGLESVKALRPGMAAIIGGPAVFYGHIVLGRLALAGGDAATARGELVLAGQSRGSPELNTFGPTMRLAYDLLSRQDAGEDDRKSVATFLDECSAFWPNESLTSWRGAVLNGLVPEFPRSLLQ
jgi:hypothetical protein